MRSEDIYYLAARSKLLGEGLIIIILYIKGHKEMPILLTSE